MAFTQSTKRNGSLAGLALLLALSACDSAGTAPTDTVNDASDTEAAMEASAGDLSAEMQAAASASGTMPCALPTLPDARASRLVSPDQSTFNTDATPETVSAFYGAAAEARDGTATKSGIPGLTEVEMALAEAGTCKATAQAQPTGDTNVTITKLP